VPWARICRRGCWADALAIARAIGDEAARAEALAGLVPHLPRAEQPAVLAEALALRGLHATNLSMSTALCWPA
jgi:hypothetical protein